MSDELSDLQRALAHSPSIEAEQDEEDWDIPLAFSAERHTEKIQGLEDIAQTWRLKDRVSVFVTAELLNFYTFLYINTVLFHFENNSIENFHL